jgi:hypothetical protein
MRADNRVLCKPASSGTPSRKVTYFKWHRRVIWSIAIYGAETWTLWAVDQKYLVSFEMWCCRWMEKTSWTDHVKNEEVLLRVKEQRNILHEISKRKGNWIGHILRHFAYKLSSTTGYWRKDKRRDRSDRKTPKKMYEATGWPWGKERILSSERGSSRLHYVESSLWKGRWTCRETDC